MSTEDTTSSISLQAGLTGLPIAASHTSATLASVTSARLDAPGLARNVVSETTSLSQILTTLIPLLSTAARRNMVYVEQLVISVTSSMLALTDLEKELAAIVGNGMLDRLKWTIREDYIREILEKLKTCKMAFQCMVNIFTVPETWEAERALSKLHTLLSPPRKKLSSKLLPRRSRAPQTLLQLPSLSAHLLPLSAHLLGASLPHYRPSRRKPPPLRLLPTPPITPRTPTTCSSPLPPLPDDLLLLPPLQHAALTRTLMIYVALRELVPAPPSCWEKGTNFRFQVMGFREEMLRDFAGDVWEEVKARNRGARGEGRLGQVGRTQLECLASDVCWEVRRRYGEGGGGEGCGWWGPGRIWRIWDSYGKEFDG
ncbi:hypothetical protein FPQ18DRAFT_156495 [Pyronema domesticum]|nr:hypothetical protein FPQ18DRAFT_156495 [Pyronema domesticum]